MVTTDWISHHPLANVTPLAKDVSDHSPLVLDTGDGLPKSYQFKFELSWLLKDDVRDIFKSIWDQLVGRREAIEDWNWKMAATRRFLKGWSKNTDNAYRKEKQKLIDMLDHIDRNAEKHGMTAADSVRKQLNDLIRSDNIKWYQRAKSVDLKLCQNCTIYFMNKAGGRKRKHKIAMLLFVLF